MFCDIGEDFNPDVNHILGLINPFLKAIIFPHLFGNPGRIDELEKALVDGRLRSKILIIDDAAQSFGAKLKGRLLCSFGDAGVISFGPGKTMTASGGGLLVTNSEHLAVRVAQLPITSVSTETKLKRLVYWIVFRRWRRVSLPFLPQFSSFLAGAEATSAYPSRLCNVDAAIGVAQMEKLDDLLTIRSSRGEKLDEVLYQPEVSTGISRKGRRCDTIGAVTKYVVRGNGAESEDFQKSYADFMQTKSIEIQGLYTPIHLSSRYGCGGDSLPSTEKACRSIIQIPVEPSIRSSEFDLVVRKFFEFIKKPHDD
jgi:perosamine synthetase